MEIHKVPLTPVDDFLYPGHSRHHMHGTPGRFGAELEKALLEAVARAGLDVVTSAR